MTAPVEVIVTEGRYYELLQKEIALRGAKVAIKDQRAAVVAFLQSKHTPADLAELAHEFGLDESEEQ